jgi:hypothetical protein
VKLRTVFIIDAIVSVLFGIPMLIAPRAMVGFSGLETDAVGLHFLRSYGAGLLSLGVMMWLARNSGPSSARTALLAGLVLWLIIDAVKEAWAALTGLVGASAWVTVVVLAILAVLNIVVGWRARSQA